MKIFLRNCWESPYTKGSDEGTSRTIPGESSARICREAFGRFPVETSRWIFERTPGRSLGRIFGIAHKGESGSIFEKKKLMKTSFAIPERIPWKTCKKPHGRTFGEFLE